MIRGFLTRLSDRLPLARAQNLEQVIDRQRRLRLAGAIVCVAFIAALGIGFQVQAAGSHREARHNHALIIRVAADERELAKQQRELAQAQAQLRAQAVQARRVSCQAANGIRAGIVAYIGSLTKPRVEGNLATLTSPAATAAQKAAAYESLLQVQAGLDITRRAFKPANCAAIAAP